MLVLEKIGKIFEVFALLSRFSFPLSANDLGYNPLKIVQTMGKTLTKLSIAKVWIHSLDGSMMVLTIEDESVGRTWNLLFLGCSGIFLLVLGIGWHLTISSCHEDATVFVSNLDASLQEIPIHLLKTIDLK